MIIVSLMLQAWIGVMFSVKVRVIGKVYTFDIV